MVSAQVPAPYSPGGMHKQDHKLATATVVTSILCFVPVLQAGSATMSYRTVEVISAVQAAELFEVESQTSEANKCRLKIAQFSAELERFPVAIEIYERVATVENNLLMYSAKGNLLNAGLCWLNGEAQTAAFQLCCCLEGT